MNAEEPDPIEWGAHYGCGRKVRPAQLADIGLTVTTPKNSMLPQVDGLFLLSDSGSARIGQELIVHTVDMVLPLPVSPEIWGRAAALHCFQIYAAGGEPSTALGYLEVGTSSPGVEKATLEAYRAGCDELNRCGVAVVGGHSLMNSISQIGFALTRSRSLTPRTVAGQRLGTTWF